MKRRGFLKALGVALAAPVVPIAAFAAPVSSVAKLDPAGRIQMGVVPELRVGRGMTSCIYHIDEAAFFPTNIQKPVDMVEWMKNSGYKKELQFNFN